MSRQTLRILRRLLAVLPCAFLLIALAAPATPLLARLLIVVFFGLTLWNPAAGLLTTAAVAPLGAFLIALDGIVHFRLTEVILLSFIGAWLIRAEGSGLRAEADEGPRLPNYSWIAAWWFSVLLASLCFALCRQLLRHEDALRTNLEVVIFHYFGYADPTGISDAARMLEGFALAGATIGLIRRRPSLARSVPVALALSTMAAALASVLLWLGIGPQQVLAREAAIGYRFAAHVLDVNAAGSQFAMILCLALGIAMRERGAPRAFWIVAAVSCAVGLLLSRSRSAEAAIGLVIPAAFLWTMTTSWPRARRVALVGSVLGVLIVFGLIRAWQIQRDPTNMGAGFRQQFVMSSFRVIGTHPYFGIGPGRYFRDSPNFLSPQLAWSYGSENAHNNYLQITTEEGIIGFFIYAAFFVGALSLAVRALARDPRDFRLLGATAGIIAFLGTCLVGHPLLLREVATLFFIQLALAAALGSSTLLNRRIDRPERPANPGRYESMLVAAGTVAFAVLPAWTLEKPLVPVHLEEVDGMYYGDEGTAEGVPFHWMRQYGTVYAPATARTIDIPLRWPLAAMTKEPTHVEVNTGGGTVATVLVDDKWQDVRVNLPSPEPPLQINRVSIRVNKTARVADLIPGSHDPRVVGLQVGDYKIIRVAWEFVPRPAEAPASP